VDAGGIQRVQTLVVIFHSYYFLTLKKRIHFPIGFRQRAEGGERAGAVTILGTVPERITDRRAAVGSGGDWRSMMRDRDERAETTKAG
jgi:hypothetical protein